MYVLILF